MRAGVTLQNCGVSSTGVAVSWVSRVVGQKPEMDLKPFTLVEVALGFQGLRHHLQYDIVRRRHTFANGC